MIVATTARPSAVYGVHGTSGLTYWKCLSRRCGTAGLLEALEWASLPAGAVSGAHLHTRTDETYFILSGHGELTLDGTRYPATPGTLAFTRPGSVHALRNVGAEDLDWLVVELSTLATHAVITGDRGTAPPLRNGKEPMTGSKVYDLNNVPAVDPSDVSGSSLSAIEVLRIEQGSSETFRSQDAEHIVFVLEGTGTAESSAATVELAKGTAITLPLGDELRVQSGTRELRLFHAAVVVPDTGGGKP